MINQMKLDKSIKLGGEELEMVAAAGLGSSTLGVIKVPITTGRGIRNRRGKKTRWFR
jgi:hypothetical protein|tara:strand:+ start:573 stop:743 length:171 start_codon:yes stop_codon:yes gene_type:complete